MARTNGSTSNGSNGGGRKVAPYFERLAGEEFRAEYQHKGKYQGEVRVYDDTADVGQFRAGVVLQTFQQTNKGRKAAVLTFEDFDAFQEYLDDLQSIKDDFESQHNAPSAKGAVKASSAGRR